MDIHWSRTWSHRWCHIWLVVMGKVIWKLKLNIRRSMQRTFIEVNTYSTYDYRKKLFVRKLRSSLSFRQITNYCNMYMCKNVQFYRICRCVNVFSFYWQFRSWQVASRELKILNNCCRRCKCSKIAHFCSNAKLAENSKKHTFGYPYRRYNFSNLHMCTLFRHNSSLDVFIKTTLHNTQRGRSRGWRNIFRPSTCHKAAVRARTRPKRAFRGLQSPNRK